MRMLGQPSSSVLTVNAREGLVQAVFYVAMAIAILAVHVVLGANFGIPGFIWIVILTLTATLVKPEASFALLLVFFFLQNAFIAYVSPGINNLNDFRLLLGSSFLNLVLTACVCVPAWVKLRYRVMVANNDLLRWMLLFLAVVAAYSVLGLFYRSPADVLLYVRVYLTGSLLFAIGIAYGFHISHSYTVSVIRVLACILVLWGIVEFFWSYDFYTFFNVASYLAYKFTASGQQEAVSTARDVMTYSTHSYLNLTGFLGNEILRPNGPEIHPITYAYCAAFTGLICFIYRSYWVALLAFCIVVLTGAKGAITLVTMTYLLYLFYYFVRRPHLLLFALITVLGIYLAAGLIYGMQIHDYHVVGFIGGLRGFLDDPLGHGIGVGGNLSSQHQIETWKDRELWQNIGASYGFESALGVMIYQMGIGFLVVLIFFWKVWRSVWKAALSFADEPRLVIVPIALAFIFVNGVFQEEAFSPAGWGLWFMFSGFLLVKRWKQDSPAAGIENSTA